MSLELERKLYGMMSGMLMSMVEGIPEDQFQQQPGKGNPPSWILGHLAIVNDYGVATVGGKPELLEEYLPVFGPGSPPVGSHPSKDVLMEMFTSSSGRFLATLDNTSEDVFNSERDSPILKEQLPKVADMIGHLLTSHISLHVGQLSAWRRDRGMDSILQLS